jgi:hypothetical protein
MPNADTGINGNGCVKNTTTIPMIKAATTETS